MLTFVPQPPITNVTSPPPKPPATMQVHRVELAGTKHDEVPPAEEMHKQAAPGLIGLAPVAVTSKEELAGMLQSAREKARAAAQIQPPPPSNNARMRWLAIGALSLVALFVIVGFSLGKNALGGSANAQEKIKNSDGVSYRHVAGNMLAKTTALADAGDTRAQARLALAYLRGQGSAGDANAALLWSLSAARAGNPVAQYLLGALYQQGDHVKADPGIAFAWFSRAAEKGNLKAMHNLAIAYAQGLGTTKDEAKATLWFTRAAERGYVDSAFDLAVLYERGTGVAQDMKQALKWYGIAALAGDVPSKARADFLRGQMKAADIKLADNAAMAFAPLPALSEANSL
jgi:TPR repeat protein